MKTTKVKVTKKPNITKSKCYDVYLGRGNGVARRFGNRHYRKTIKLHKERYQQTKGNKQKARVAVDVTDAFESEGATFYYKPQKGKDWEVAPRSKVLKTIKQALREKASATDKSEEDEEEKKVVARVSMNGETVEAAVWDLRTQIPVLSDSPPNELRQTADVCQQQQAPQQKQQLHSYNPSLFLDSSRTHSVGTIDNIGNDYNNNANDEDQKEKKQSNTDPQQEDYRIEPVQDSNEGKKMSKDISIRSMLSESIKTFFVESNMTFEEDDSDSDSDSEEFIKPADPMFLSEVRRKKSSLPLIDNGSADYVQRKISQNYGSNKDEKSTVFEGRLQAASTSLSSFQKIINEGVIEQDVDPLYYRYPRQDDGSDSEDSLQPAQPIFLKDTRVRDVSMLSFRNSDKEIKSTYSEEDTSPAQPSDNVVPSKSKDSSFRDMLCRVLETPSFLDPFQRQIVDDAEEDLTPSKPVFLKDSSMRSFRSKNMGKFDMGEVNPPEDSFRSLNL
jgi:hypothetical protein